jgi:ABC-type multidrug transport system ATPase subunit
VCQLPPRTAELHAVLRADGLTARYAGQRHPALRDVHLSLSRGERLLLVGPNGAGKSTFIRVFAGLMRPSRGQALVSEMPARNARHLTGVVSHATYLYDELTAMENLRFYGELYEVPRPVQRATELLGLVGLQHLAHEPVGRLSRGQQQRVTLARALLHDPPLLLLDEPDTGLDVAAWQVLSKLTTQDGRTVVLTTHNLRGGLELATRVAVLAHGVVVHERAAAAPADATELRALVQRLAAQ